MTISLLRAALLLSCDGFIIAAFLGGLVSSWNRLPLAATFGLCDGLASLAGGLLGSCRPELVPASFVLAAAGVYGLLVLSGWRRSRGVALRTRLAYALPFVFSLDNFAVGGCLTGDVPQRATGALALAAVSGAMALAGLSLGSWVRRTCSRVATAGEPR